MTRFFCFRTKGTKALWFALVSRSTVGLVMTQWALPRYFRWSVFVDLKLTEYIFSVTVAQNRIPKQVTWSSSSSVTSELLHFSFIQWIVFTYGWEKKRTRFLGKSDWCKQAPTLPCTDLLLDQTEFSGMFQTVKAGTAWMVSLSQQQRGAAS